MNRTKLEGPKLKDVVASVVQAARAARPARVLDVTRQCVTLFGRIYADQTIDPRTKADVENQLGRFKIWAGSIGVFATGKASTDFRLRNDEDVKELLIDLLIRLRRAIDGFLKPFIQEEIEDDRPPEAAAADSDDDSEDSLVLSIGDESNATTVESKIPSHQVTSLQDIDGIISKLYRFSAIIRKPTSLQENTRVAKFIEKVEDKADVTEFASHVRWQIGFRLPDASDEIVDRLANAVTFRRRKLSYRERHQKKLSQGLESVFQTEVLLPVKPTAPQRSNAPGKRSSGPFLKSAASVKSSSSTIPLSATEASTVNRRALASYPKSLAGGSNITKSAVARRNQLDVPPPPKSEDTREAVCPYCFEVVDKAGMARPLWTIRRHILKDIDPYVCLFEGCSRPNEQYESFDDWISHMKWQHTLVWSCHAPRHTQLKFDTATECEAHMRQDHSQEISSAQISLLVEKSAQPAADPLAVLLREDDAGRSVCPLCPFAVENTRVPEPHGLIPDASASVDNMKQMRDHIAAHLESIALLSLPEQEELENAASDEVQSESARRSSRGDDHDREPLFPTADAWDDYNMSKEIDSSPLSVDPASLTEDEDWIFLLRKIPFRESKEDPGQDPVLLPFVERARRIQMLAVLERDGFPVIVVNDPDGLEVPEPQWASTPELL
ncbi:MAG: hypothetical protein Q9219_003312 [cf. Caloplaca sp. 3 TL-2023]